MENFLLVKGKRFCGGIGFEKWKFWILLLMLCRKVYWDVDLMFLEMVCMLRF